MKNFVLILFMFGALESWAKKSLQFNCGGFEPSFSLKIRDQKINYSSPSIDPCVAKVIETKFKGKSVQIMAESSQGKALDILITPDANCVSDGIGDKGKETHKIEFKIDKEVYSGCCRQIGKID